MGNEIQFNLAFQHHFFQQLVFAHIGADVFANLSRGQQQAHAEAVDAHVIADGGEILDAFADQGADQVLRDAAQAEAAHHDYGAVGDIADRFVDTADYLVHSERF